MKSLKRGTLHWKDDWILNTIFCCSHLVESHISVSWGTKHVDCPPLYQKHQLGWVPWNQHETTTFCWKNACFSGSFFKFPVPNPRKNIRISTTLLQYSKPNRGHIQITVSKSLSWWDDFFSIFLPACGVRIRWLEKYIWNEKLPMYWKNDAGYLRIFVRCLQLTHLSMPGWWHGNITDDMSQVEFFFWVADMTGSDFDILFFKAERRNIKLSSIIKPSSKITKHHQRSPNIIKHHQTSSMRSFRKEFETLVIWVNLHLFPSHWGHLSWIRVPGWLVTTAQFPSWRGANYIQS